MSLAAIIKTTRPSFLVLSPICVFLGLSTALATETPVNMSIFILILVGAISAHISVNTLNEYSDFKSGLDFKTQKTAFSGGSGALPAHPELEKTILILGLLSLILTVAIGIYLVVECGFQIFPLGVVGVMLIIFYTQWINRSALLCLVAPGLGFGILMVLGTHVILTGGYSQLSLLVSLVPFFLINNLLLLNQYPDIKADESVGRKTFPIAFGINNSNVVYTAFFLVAYSLILVLVIKGYLPLLSLSALIPMIFSLYAAFGANKHTEKIGSFPQYMAANVAAVLLAPLLLAISVFVG
jgi:1,4-dihydroxy-2-naphthoate octaprenyltransferase